MKNVFMSGLTTLGIGGRAKEVVTPTEKTFGEEIRRLREEYGQTLVLGRGSKVLCADAGYNGGVLLTRGLDREQFDGKDVYVGAGVNLAALSVRCAERGLSGLEWAVGIPASIGGAVTLNAGAFGGCMAEIVTEVACLDDDYPAASCGFCYRGSVFDHGRHVVTGAWLHLEDGDRDRIRARMHSCREERLRTQPHGVRTAGSAFRRVGETGAGYYIERAGCKGMRIGDVCMSAKHANFLQNCGGATCKDAVKLLSYIQRKVFAEFGIELDRDIIEVK